MYAQQHMGNLWEGSYTLCLLKLILSLTFFFFPFLSTLVPFYIIVQSGTSFLQTPFSQLSPWKNSSFVFLSIVSLLLRRQPFVKARMNANVTPTFFFFIISQILRFTNSHMD